MDRHSLIRSSPLPRMLPAACAGLLITSCVYGNQTGNGPAHNPMVASAASSASPVPANGRHKYYTQDEFTAAASEFTRHIKVLVGTSRVDVDSPVLRIPWSGITHVQDSIGKEKPVQGIHINHGLDGTRYHPVIQFMFAANAMGDLELFPDTWFSFDPATGHLVPEKDPGKFMDAYLENIRVDRTGSGFSELRPAGEDPDPLAIWFPYADNVSQLLAQNPCEDPYLVVSSISEALGIRAVHDPTSSAQFRHLLTLHIADGSKDLLSNTFDPYKPFREMALDLGNPCPPMCKQP
ncbi:MAG: hypothetical protein K8H89_13235 [Flavobacteriales bacterium]|nr:hypothetical protein [Flavobacteriales bacterium]